MYSAIQLKFFTRIKIKKPTGQHKSRKFLFCLKNLFKDKLTP